MRNCVLSPVSKTRDIGKRSGYKSRAEGDSVQVGGGGEENTASDGKCPEGEAESEDDNVQQSLYGPGSGLRGVFAVRCV